MSRNAAVHRFEYDGWDVVIEMEGSTLDGVMSGHADLSRAGEHKCRIALAGKHQSGASAMTSLADRARGFIDAWAIEHAEGASPFIKRRA